MHLAAARPDASARDRDGYAPIDTAEYWAARAPARSLDCLAALAVIPCYEGIRTDFAHAADPAAFVDVHRRLANDARRSSRTVPWADEPWASLGVPHALAAPPYANRARPPADSAHAARVQPSTSAPTSPVAAQPPLVTAARTDLPQPASPAKNAPDAIQPSTVANADASAEQPRRSSCTEPIARVATPTFTTQKPPVDAAYPAATLDQAATIDDDAPDAPRLASVAHAERPAYKSRRRLDPGTHPRPVDSSDYEGNPWPKRYRTPLRCCHDRSSISAMFHGTVFRHAVSRAPHALVLFSAAATRSQ